MANRTRADLLAFLDHLANKGLLPKPTVQNRKAAVNAVLGILSDDETADVSSIDIAHTLTRFANLQGSKYTPSSMNTYGSRVRAAIDDFVRYQENPLGFKVGGKATSQPRAKAAVKVGTSTPAQTTATSGSSDKPIPSMAEPTILPIPIRANLVVFVQGLPHDLTKAEANKIANVVKAMGSEE
jgi:hypothetical protein